MVWQQAADEGDYRELETAVERVGEWMSVLRSSDVPIAKRKEALLQLAKAVEAKEAYAEQARLEGAVDLLTKMLSKTDDEECIEAICDVVAGCSGPTATGIKHRTFQYGAGCSVNVVEGSLSDGLGARVWMVAHVLSRELFENPGIVAGRRVLELGSGVGVTGIVAAKAGARCVTLTDCVPQVLHLLQRTVAANAAAVPSGACTVPVDDTSACCPLHPAAAAAGDDDDTSACCPLHPVADAAGDDDDDDDIGRLAALGELGRAEEEEECWDYGNMHVRRLDWEDCKAALQGGAGGYHPPCVSTSPRKLPASSATLAKAAPPPAAAGGSSSGSGPRQELGSAPELPPSERYDVIIGTDLIYEMAMAESLPAAIATRLAPGGRCMVANLVREKRLHNALVANLRAAGLRVHVEQVTPQFHNNDGIMGRAEEYEGGFMAFFIDHQDSPSADWHRDDLFLLPAPYSSTRDAPTPATPPAPHPLSAAADTNPKGGSPTPDPRGGLEDGVTAVAA